MPRTKGSKNRSKTNTTKDYAPQIAEKQEQITTLTTEIASESNRGAEVYTERAEDCSEEGRKRSGIPGSKEGKGRC